MLVTFNLISTYFSLFNIYIKTLFSFTKFQLHSANELILQISSFYCIEERDWFSLQDLWNSLSLFYQKAVLETSLRFRKPCIGPAHIYPVFVVVPCFNGCPEATAWQRERKSELLLVTLCRPSLHSLYTYPFNEIALVFGTVSDHNLTRWSLGCL